MEQLLAIMSEIRPDIDFETENELIDADILDSFDINCSILQDERKYTEPFGSLEFKNTTEKHYRKLLLKNSIEKLYRKKLLRNTIEKHY